MANKYGAKKTYRIVNGKPHQFDSMAEARYYDKLLILLKAGHITDLQLQPRYIIADYYRIETTATKSGKSKVGELKYTPDFTYIEGGKRIVIEVKGRKTADYQIRKKIFMSLAWREYEVSEFHEVVSSKTTKYYTETVR